MIPARSHNRAFQVAANILLDCLKSFAFPEMRYRQDEVQDTRADSCDWILEHKAYKSWISHQHGLLWIKGKPGSGKSTLMKRIYKENATQANIRLAFFFHRRGVQLQQTSMGMLRTISHQLISQSASARAVFRARYNEKKSFGHYGIDWEWHDAELRQILKSALAVATKSHAISIFVDALDEASENSAEPVVAYIYKVNEELQGSARQTRICFSCRHYPIFSLNIGFEVCMETENNDDISACIDQELLKHIQAHKRQSREDDIKVLQRQLSSSASGVFLWASLMVPIVAKEYNKGKSLKHVLETLQRAPPNLGSIYEHILKTLIDAEDRKDSLHLMQWISLANRPLSLTELRFALALDDPSIHDFQNSVQDSEDFVEDDVRMEQLITSQSGGLIEVRDHNGSSVVQFIHQSVNDSLLKGGFEWLGLHSRADVIGQGHHRLARSCVNYLKLGEIQEVERLSPCRSQGARQNPPFLEYAIQSWFLHAQIAERKGITQNDLIQRFEWPNVHYFQNWIDMFHAIDEYSLNPRRPHLLSTLLHIAAASNLQSIVQELVAVRPLVEQKDSQGNGALHFAARFGHDRVVSILLNAEANLQAQNLNGYTALERAASGGHTNTIELLLKNGADVNYRTDHAGNALCSAISARSYLATRMLLQNGAKINVQGGPYGNALHTAACEGSEPIIKLLLNKGADIHAQGEPYGNALQAAAIRGHEPIVKLLLNKGADIHAQGGLYGNALQAAAVQGHEPIIKLPLNKGVDIHAQSGLYGNALQAAAVQGHEPIVKLLLNKGADVYAQGGLYGNTLQAAAYWGSEPIIKLLLNKGADIHAQGGLYGNTLQAAAVRGREPIVKLLLNKGADIHAQGGKYGNALQAAVYRGREPIVKLLLNKGADIHAQGGKYGNALQAAVYRGREPVVKLLFTKSANLTNQDSQGRYPFHLAIRGGHYKLIDFVLSNIGIPDWNYQDLQGCSALHFAASGGSNQIAQVILESNIDINLLDTYGWTALHWACRNGSRKIVDILKRSGADLNRKDISGWTPLDVATFCQNDSLASLFQDNAGQAESKQLTTRPGRRQYQDCSSCYHVSYVLTIVYD
jgi:ankyrin repeat protein